MINEMKGTMKKLIAVLLFAAIAPTTFADSGITPAMIVVTNFRDAAVSYPNSTEYYQGDSALFTNCVAYSGAATNSALQQLSNVTVRVTVGFPSGTNNVIYTGTVNSAASGVWSCLVRIPTNNEDCYFHVTLIDAVTNSYTYQQMKLNTKPKL